MAKLFTKFWNRETSQADNSASNPAVQGGSFKPNTVHINNASSALSVPAWYRALDVRSSTMAQLVMEYQKKNDRPHGGNYEQDNRGDGRTINYLLQVQPNPTMTAAQFWKQLTLNHDNHGNGVAYVERDYYGAVKYIWLCSVAVLDITSLTYSISYNSIRGQVNLTNVDASDIIHWRNTYSFDNGLTGVGILRFAIQSLSTAATNDKQAQDIASKGGKYKILLSEKDRPGGMDVLNLLNKDQKEQQKEDLKKALEDGEDVILMSGMMDAKPISQDAQAQQLLDSRKFDVVQISRFTGVPLSILSDKSNNTYKAPEQEMQVFLQFTISPMARELEDEFNAKLLGQAGFPTHRYRFNEDSILRLDPQGRANVDKVLFEMGAKCVNELRAERDLPAINGGDRHFISTNLQPLDSPKVAANQEGGAS